MPPLPAITDTAALLVALDLAGTFVFALSGGLLAVRKHLDVVGVGVLAVAAGLGGGLLRDVLIAARPPAALDDQRYLVVALLAGVVAAVAARALERLGPAVRVFDAAGLGLFTVAGTTKALAAGLPPVAAIMLGILTGVGGGAVRDILAGEIPLVLRRDVYALAALAGALLVTASVLADRAGPAAALAAAATTFLIRLLALRFGWDAPRPPAR